MDTQTVQKLNRINQHFYLTVADDFDQTRQQPWQGWQTLEEKKVLSESKTVIDVGCGNGRFAAFIQQKNENYLGLDNNPLLLKEAQQYAESFQLFKLKSFDIINTLIDKSFTDKLSKELDSLAFTRPFLVCLFGVIHHIPSFQLRSDLLTSVASVMQKDDKLTISCWQFTKIANLIKRKIDPQVLELPSLEENDFILDWQRGTTAFRYCHLVTDDEMKQLAEQANLEIIDSWQNDGKTNNLNNYYLLQKKEYNHSI